MSTARKRILSLALAVCLLLGMTLAGPVTVSAADVGIEDGPPSSVTVGVAATPSTGDNSGPLASDVTVLAFGGQEWYVIGYDDDGVYSDPGTMTLLAKDNIGSDIYYNNSPDSSYENSNLQNAILAILPAMDSREQDMLEARDLDDTYDSDTDYNGLNTPITNQPLWPLSVDEAMEVSYSVRNAASGNWWLRSPSSTSAFAGDYVAFVGSGAVLAIGYNAHYYQLGVRPAFRLNLSSVIFTSDASGASKPATAGSTLTPAQPVAQNLKLTVEDSGLTLTSDTADAGTHAPGDTVELEYSGATTTTGLYISCVIVDEDDDDKVLYYGKLDDTGTATGTVEFDVPLDIADGDYTIKLFVEEINTGNHTDFASKPEEIPLKVKTPTAAKLEVTAPTFSAEPVNYSQPPAQAITIKNTGDTDATITDVSLTSGDTTAFDIDDAAANLTVNGKSENITWTIQPEAGLGEKTYTAEITVTYDGGENTTDDTATTQVKFVVQADPPAPGTPALTANRTNMNFGEVETGDSKTDTVEVTGTDLTLSIGYSVSGVDAAAFSVSAASGWSDTDGGDLEVSFSPDDERDYAAVLTISSSGAADVTVTLSGKGVAEGEGGNGNNGNGGSTSSSSGRSRSSSGGSSTPDSRVAKTQLPASAFSWDGDHTLTIDHERITPLGLLTVRWDDVETTAYSKYSGSVIVRFDADFIASQAPGNHTVRVEFLNHTGETTVTVGQTAATEEPAGHPDNDTHNPNTGGYPDGGMGTTDNPNTGDGGGVWPALLLGSLGAVGLAVFHGKRRLL